ncbi:putative oxidoreductase [Pseudocercospora fuligena]|uniref:Putative oxidoreductase n=1 Tax=Pseudocercospora fuligena TaxID=685502 RepID=A0A8H6RGP0_9PEZI|nr:putative oxidoreductase [Pseudocercospora fuligena]
MSKKTWAIVGASRGIGAEFVKQLLDRQHNVIATTRKPISEEAQSRWPSDVRPSIYDLDILSEPSIDAFVAKLLQDGVQRIDSLVLNAGVLKYPNRATEISYADFAFHLHTNTIGPIICAQRILQSSIAVGTVAFISSHSGSTQAFRPEEDGFAAHAASKAALNQMLRHMAAKLKRKDSTTTVIALHPGEVATDMANIDLGCEVVGQMTPTQSVSSCIPVIESKQLDESETFWTWKDKVRLLFAS